MIGRAPLRAPNHYPIVGSQAGSGEPHGLRRGDSADEPPTLDPGAQAAFGAFGLRRQAYGVSRCRERGHRADEELPHGALMARGGFWHRNRCQNHPKGMRIMPETSAPCASNPYEGVATRRGAGGLQGGLPNLISSPHPLLLSDFRGLGHHRVSQIKARARSSSLVLGRLGSSGC